MSMYISISISIYLSIHLSIYVYIRITFLLCIYVFHIHKKSIWRSVITTSRLYTSSLRPHTLVA